MEILAIIPARGGSKGIPKKNIKPLGNIPLIAYSIAAGLQAKNVNRVIVSTDDKKIGECAIRYGAEVPFLRPGVLSGDHVQDFPVIEHVLLWLKKKENYKPDVIVFLRPTSPFRPLGCIDEAVEIMHSKPDADCVRAVMRSGEEPYKMWRIKRGRMVPLLKSNFHEQYNMPRQKLPKTYWQTGQIEVIRYGTIMNKKSISGKRIYPIIMDPKFIIDIDSLDQWEIAECMIRKFRKTKDIYLPQKEF
ncbi:MAG: acylneuraminate cytidylyltransferase family protein [Elusimicrobiota bacterium]